MKFLTLPLILLSNLIALNVHATDNDIYTVYLVRHADKVTIDKTNRNPQLTECGKKRSKHLVKLLKHIEINAIYSTDYLRTQATASPIAKDRQLVIKSYNPGKLDELTEIIKRNEKNALVVGHNSTTNVVAGNLASMALPVINEKEYDRLYQVTITKQGANLQLLNQGFNCKD